MSYELYDKSNDLHLLQSLYVISSCECSYLFYLQAIVQDIFHLHPIIKQKPSRGNRTRKKGKHKAKESMIFFDILNNSDNDNVLFPANLLKS